MKSLFLLAVLSMGSTSMWADNYEIVFKTAEYDSNSDLGATPNVSNVVETGSAYVANFSNCAEMYVGQKGIKLGTSSKTGTINFTLASGYQSNIKSIKVVSVKYGSDTGTLTLYSGNTTLKTEIKPGTDYTHTFDTPTTVSSIKLTTSTKRAYITKIILTTQSTPSYTLTAVSNNTDYGTVSVSGNKITANPTSGYRVSTTTPYEVTSGTATVIQNGNEFTVTASTDCTVRINFEALPTYTVAFSDGGSVTEESYGAGVTLPTRNAIADYSFVGWSETDITTETTTVPSIIASGAYSPTANITLYPVYKRTADENESKTATVIISSYATANNWVLLTGQYQTVSIDNNIIATATEGQYTGHYTNDGWKFYQTDGGKLTLTAANGCELTSATLTFTANNNGTLNYGETQVASNTPVSLSGTTAEFEVKRTGSGSNGQIAFSKMVVNYNQNTVKYYTSHPITTATITLNAACNDGSTVYGTYSSSRAFVVSNDIVVSEIRVTNGSLVVSSYETGDIVPANTGVMVSALEGGDYTVQLATGGTSILGNDNMLKPTGDNGISADDMNAANTKFYRLTMHNGTQIGYWWGAAEGAAFDLTANKAYLAVPSSAGARIQSLWFDSETTGVSDVRSKIYDGRGEVFDLQGRRVAQPTRGLYIINGKTVIINKK